MLRPFARALNLRQNFVCVPVYLFYIWNDNPRILKSQTIVPIAGDKQRLLSYEATILSFFKIHGAQNLIATGSPIMIMVQLRTRRRWISNQFPFLSTLIQFVNTLLFLGFVSTLLTTHSTYASACQPYHHDNQCNYGNNKSYDVKKVVLVPRDVKHLSSEMPGSTMSDHILYPITSCL